MANPISNSNTKSYSIAAKQIEVRFSDHFSFTTFNKPMVKSVLPSLFKDIKIFWSIVGLYFINMMDNLFWREESTNDSFYDKSVFWYISLIVGVGMVGLFNQLISLSYFLATLPIVMVFSTIISGESFIPGFLQSSFIFIPGNITLSECHKFYYITRHPILQ